MKKWSWIFLGGLVFIVVYLIVFVALLLIFLSVD
jgi:hypothetical protein